MMDQRNTSYTEQVLINSGCEVSVLKQRLSAADHGCSICRGAGWMRVDSPYGDPSFGKSTPCSCLQERQKLLIQRQLRQAANLEAFSESTFKTFNYRIPGVQEAVRLSLTYSTHPQGWLLFVGPCGCGKRTWLPLLRTSDWTMMKRFSSPPSLTFLTCCELLLSRLSDTQGSMRGYAR